MEIDMNKLFFIAPVVLLACTKEKASFETVEQARMQARENAEYIAQNYRAKNPVFADLDIYSRGDSTINAKCPQGDGWASIDLRDKNGMTKEKLKCSTVSISIGCLTEKDFKSKSYATEDGKCNPEIPHPLPKIVK